MKDNQLWLHRLFNSPSFNTWSTVSYLSRYSSNGIRYYLLQKLKTQSIAQVYPQLVYIYKNEFSYPMYEFLSEPNLVIYFLVRNDRNEVDLEILRNARIRSRRYRSSRGRKKQIDSGSVVSEHFDLLSEESAYKLSEEKFYFRSECIESELSLNLTSNDNGTDTEKDEDIITKLQDIKLEDEFETKNDILDIKASSLNNDSQSESHQVLNKNESYEDLSNQELNNYNTKSQINKQETNNLNAESQDTNLQVTNDLNTDSQDTNMQVNNDLNLESQKTKKLDIESQDTDIKVINDLKTDSQETKNLNAVSQKTKNLNIESQNLKIQETKSLDIESHIMNKKDSKCQINDFKINTDDLHSDVHQYSIKSIEYNHNINSTQNKDTEHPTKLLQTTYNYCTFPTPIIPDTNHNLTLLGLLLFITKSVTSIISEDINIKLNKYQNTFVKKEHTIQKQKKNIFSGTLFDSTNWLLPSIRFYDELTGICKRLKLLPRSIRQKGLEIELVLINQNLPGNVLDIDMKINVVNIVSEFSYVLDSAENSPFFMIVEVCNLGGKSNRAEWKTKKIKSANSDCEILSDNNKSTKNDENITVKEKCIELKQKFTSKYNCDILEYNSETRSKEESINDIDNRNIDNQEKSQFYKQSEKNIEYINSDEALVTITEDVISEEDVSEDADDEEELLSEKNDRVETCDNAASADITEIYKPNIIENGKNYTYRNVNYTNNSFLNSQIKDKSVYKNAAILLHQLYDLNDCTSINNAELAIIKEKIISQIQSIKVEYNMNDLTWNEKKKLIAERSKYKNKSNYDIKAVIIKRGNDLRQEVLAIQLMQEMLNIFVDEKLSVYLNCYQIYLIDKNSALIEAVNDVVSIHYIKKRHRSLKEYYRHKHAGNYGQAIDNFVNSLVGYSLATYFLQVKDRHNGNILVDSEGHLIHVDFGFILGSHPGFYNVERAPFKFSQEYIDLLGDNVSDFKSMFIEGFMALRKNCDRLCKIIEILCDKGTNNYVNKNVIAAFRERFKMELNDKDVEKWIIGLIAWSLNSMGTGLYDSYQYFSNGYRK